MSGYELDLRLNLSGVRQLSIANDNPTGTNRSNSITARPSQFFRSSYSFRCANGNWFFALIFYLRACSSALKRSVDGLWPWLFALYIKFISANESLNWTTHQASDEMIWAVMDDESKEISHTKKRISSLHSVRFFSLAVVELILIYPEFIITFKFSVVLFAQPQIIDFQWIFLPPVIHRPMRAVGALDSVVVASFSN